MLYFLEILLGILIFMFGASLFSFLSVIAYRVPRNQSFTKGFSHCPACKHRLGVWDLIPVLSYLLLRGKCRYCGARIGSREPLTECLGGFLALLCVACFSSPWEAFTIFAFLSILTLLTLFDLDTMEIPTGCQIAVLVLAGISIFTMPGPTLVSRGIGFLCVSLPMLLLALVLPGAFGGGDIKLMAAAGLFLGWKMTVMATLLAIWIGGIYGIYLLVVKKKNRKDAFAFGPFLCLGMAMALFVGEPLLAWYLGLFGI